MATSDEHRPGPDEPPDITDLSAPDDHAGPRPPHASKGYEPDEINIRPILYIGAALVLVCALAYVAVTVVFSYIHVGAEDPVTYPMAAEKAAAPINERFARIDSVGEEAEVRQPRLEALQRRRYAPGEPPYVRSPVPTAEGNPPFYHPEDLRAERVPALNRYEWVNKDKNVAAIPIEQAMEAALEMGLYQTQKAAPKEGGGTEGREEPEGQEAKKPEPGKKEPAPKPEGGGGGKE